MIRSYAVVTPARDEADNLPRLAASLAAQTASAARVARSSTTGRPTRRSTVAEALAAEHDWISVLLAFRATASPTAARRSCARSTPASRRSAEPADVRRQRRRGRLVRARLLRAPAREVRRRPGARHRERQLPRARATATGGSGTSPARPSGARHARIGGSASSTAAARGARGWDGIDEFKANARGWRTMTFEDLPFRHHRREGERDGAACARARPGPCGALHRLPALVSRAARALERAPRAGGTRHDLGLRSRRAHGEPSGSGRRSARVSSPPAEPA